MSQEIPRQDTPKFFVHDLKGHKNFLENKAVIAHLPQWNLRQNSPKVFIHDLKGHFTGDPHAWDALVIPVKYIQFHKINSELWDVIEDCVSSLCSNE